MYSKFIFIMEINNDRYLFWLDNPTVLYKNGNYANIVPTSSMSRVEQLNALTRFFIYYIILLLMFKKTDKWVLIPIVFIVLIVITYNIYKVDDNGKSKDFLNEHFTNDSLLDDNLNNGLNKKTSVQTGYYDSDNVLRINKKKKKLDRKYTPDELIEYSRATCRRPTPDNPFMNPLTSDFGKEDVPVACNADDEDIKEQIMDNFNKDLYRDIDDLFDIKNSQRQFYTIPYLEGGIPDTIGLANWLYSNPEGTCNTNQNLCLRYEDIKYKR
jgi:hypothetical protein